MQSLETKVAQQEALLREILSRVAPPAPAPAPVVILPTDDTPIALDVDRTEVPHPVTTPPPLRPRTSSSSLGSTSTATASLRSLRSARRLRSRPASPTLVEDRDVSPLAEQAERTPDLRIPLAVGPVRALSTDASGLLPVAAAGVDTPPAGAPLLMALGEEPVPVVAAPAAVHKRRKSRTDSTGTVALVDSVSSAVCSAPASPVFAPVAAAGVGSEPDVGGGLAPSAVPLPTKGHKPGHRRRVSETQSLGERITDVQLQME
ncbi:hypothetical protein PAPYR_10888 [Paratrimastix pyriformis]|uniref:Uncharacterized protein n=1 Tax=Paratrimastix pyriformis TaxID=342808 RepID=A0ABQ8U4Z6_9EUKA|nr:hypothetical protein PAPYR_10888 [Paratrimastix pyriformis]